MLNNSCTLYRFRKEEDGVSLIGVCFIIVVMGLISGVLAHYYNVYSEAENQISTTEKLAEIDKAMTDYVSFNGRYPCPAPITAPSASPAFGKEADCTTAVAGTFTSAGRDGRNVRTGALPVRTLGLSDEYMFDAYKNRLVYAVTEVYTQATGAPIEEDMGAISIVDDNNNNSTNQSGNIVHVVYSMGEDINGTYAYNGNLLQPCDNTLRSGENCDFTTNAVFKNTGAKSKANGSVFLAQMTYQPAKTPYNCITAPPPPSAIPREVAFVVDTSGSMASNGVCPGTLGSQCSRIDVARWAMRRVMHSRLQSMYANTQPGRTLLSGFVGYNNISSVNNGLNNPANQTVFDDPNASGYTQRTDAEILADTETRLQNMCPTGSTPLGLHIQAMAQRLSATATPQRPNKIMILSDGASNNGINPVAVANMMATNYPNVQVDIVDMVGTSNLINVANITGGNYYYSANPDDLLNSLFSATGTCMTSSPPSITDSPGCGSSGGWW